MKCRVVESEVLVDVATVPKVLVMLEDETIGVIDLGVFEVGMIDCKTCFKSTIVVHETDSVDVKVSMRWCEEQSTSFELLVFLSP